MGDPLHLTRLDGVTVLRIRIGFYQVFFYFNCRIRSWKCATHKATAEKSRWTRTRRSTKAQGMIHGCLVCPCCSFAGCRHKTARELQADRDREIAESKMAEWARAKRKELIE
jgi:hypothetical protein